MNGSRKDVQVTRVPQTDPCQSEQSEESPLLDVTATVHLSPTFYGWLFQYAGEMTVIAPEHVRKEYSLRLRRAMKDARETRS